MNVYSYYLNSKINEEKKASGGSVPYVDDKEYTECIPADTPLSAPIRKKYQQYEFVGNYDHDEVKLTIREF